MVHTPWDLIVWALAAAVALVVLGIGLALALAIIRAAVPSKTAASNGTSVYSSKSHT